MIKYATVVSGGTDYKVKFFGEDFASEMIYKRLAIYSPVEDDVVAFIVDEKGKYLCLGKIE